MWIVLRPTQAAYGMRQGRTCLTCPGSMFVVGGARLLRAWQNCPAQSLRALQDCCIRQGLQYKQLICSSSSHATHADAMQPVPQHHGFCLQSAESGSYQSCPTYLRHAHSNVVRQRVVIIETSLQVIKRMGHWIYDAMVKSYLTFFKPAGLLAAGEWPGAAKNDYGQFFHERFMMTVPEELVEYLFPHLPELKRVCVHSVWLTCV